MRNVAIVEDEEKALETLKGYLIRYGESYREAFNVFHFPDSFSLLENYTGNYDVILMDIMLPDLNGMELARRVRALDKSVAIIFVTNMAQFAVNGYEVDASDFIVKPVAYGDFATKLKRTLDKLDGKNERKIFIVSQNVTLILDAAEIKWVEVILHKLVYHTTQGVAEAYGSLKKAEELLAEEKFIRANKSVLVNPRFITAVKDGVVMADKDTIYLSRKYKKDFSERLSDYYGEKKG